jgi:hypothetical protein
MEYKTETKTCQNCKNDFIIEPDDFSFYEKIKVPPPTFCPECRFIRRFASTNERVLYKRKCDLSGEDIFSMYPEDAPFPVYKTEDWYSDKWDSYIYGMDYDFSKSFFEQFMELQSKVPRMALVRQGMSVNSPYAHRASDPKNSYMVFRATSPVDSLYSYIGENMKDCCDCCMIFDCELCYECTNCGNCYNTRFSQESSQCRDCFFVYGCRNCSNCIGCVNLINKQYFIFNQQYTKDEYFKKLEELKLNTNFGLEYIERKFKDFRKKFPQRAIISLKSENVLGNWFTNCKNVNNSFRCINVKDGKYLFAIFNAGECMDFFEWGNKAELIYESENCGLSVSRLSFCNQCWTGAHDLTYCDSCPGSSNCFGCIGLKKGEYSILNKKYSKEKYEIMKEKIIRQMKEIPYVDKKGIKYGFGEHFPDSLSCFAYNETAAYDFFPLTKEEIISKGYKWKEREKKNYKTTIDSSSLPETIEEVNDSILNEIISCAEKNSQYSVGAYRITEDELSFYRKMDLPLPRVCFDVRHMRRLNKLPNFKLQKRNCSKCNLEVDTVYNESFAPIIYCEKCYQQEVY